MGKSKASRDKHFSNESLAALAAGERDGESRQHFVDHLARCARCLAVYAEFARAGVGHSLADSADMPAPELLAIARDLPHVAGWGEARYRRSPGVPRPVLAGLATAVMVALALFGSRLAERTDATLELRRMVAQQIRVDSYGGLLFGDDWLPERRMTRGSEGELRVADLAPLVDNDAWKRSPEAAHWLVAGLLAANHLRDAEPYLRESLERFPHDLRFHNLAAILAYKRSDLVAAESELRAALTGTHRASLLLNLARVLEEEGRTQEATELLAEVSRRYADTPFAVLARERAVAGLVR